MLLSCLVVLRWGSSLWTCVNSRVHVAQNASTDQRSLPVFPGRGTVRKRHAKNSSCFSSSGIYDQSQASEFLFICTLHVIEGPEHAC